jgi:NAD(P)-dependent dehydrogenase (short-subunit alcohol dehydrogenase family)
MDDFPRFDLQGRIALVTGAARGLGRAISLALAHAGADIALGLRDVNTGGDLEADIQKLGRKALPLQMDMSKLDQISTAIEQAAAHFGHLDILVNNAGIAPDNLAENVTEKDFDATLAIEGNVLRQSGSGANNDSPEIWADHQHEFAGRLCGASD